MLKIAKLLELRQQEGDRLIDTDRHRRHVAYFGFEHGVFYCFAMEQG